MTSVLAIGVALAGVGLLLAWSGLRRLMRLQLAAGANREMLGLGSLLGAAVFLLLGSNLAVYHRLVYEAPVANIRFQQLGPMHYRVQLAEQNTLTQSYELRGDEWQLDARILKWHGFANLFGLDTQYRLHRLAGRYTSIDREREAARSIYEVSSPPQIDLWKLANDYERWLDWLVDAAYGSAVYLPMTHEAEYEVTVSQTGLVARPVNEQAKRAVSRWIGF